MKNNLLDTAENALLEILKREITGQDRTEKTELSVAGLKTVMRLAKEHAVTGLVANPSAEKNILLAAHAADLRGDDGTPAGAFVYNGELLSKEQIQIWFL